MLLRTAAWRAAAAPLTVLAVLAPTAAGAQGAFPSLTFFGDSYVDSGNAFLLSQGTQPPAPYFEGRFSNGRVWVEYFAESLGRPSDAAPAFAARAASGNYAVAGARSGPGGLTTTQGQVGSYLTRPGGTPGTVADPGGLYTLFAGGNDLRDASGVADPVARQAEAVAAAQRVLTQAGALAQAGARNVLLFTLPSLGSSPESQGIPGRPEIQNQLFATFNATLGAGIGTLGATYGGTTFFNLRLDNLLTNVLLDAQAGGGLYGITNVTTPCFGPPIGPPSPPSCDASLWVDGFHPTTRVHALIGQAAFRYVTTGQNVAVIPEPATGALAAAGLAALAATAAARRRRGRAA
jgi:outer membrane lipase/esterase